MVTFGVVGRTYIGSVGRNIHGIGIGSSSIAGFYFIYFVKRTAVDSRLTVTLRATAVIMEEELQRLREEMAQLRAENERLSGQAERLSVSDERSDASNNVQSPPPPQRREQTVYLPRERKCPKFSGSGSAGALTVDEWVEEVEGCLRARHMSKIDKALFVYDHLEGAARTEIKYRDPSVREDSEQILNILQEVYGCSKSYVALQQKFFDRKQKEGESLQDFSHALMMLMERVTLCEPQAMSNSQMLLRDQFCENVRDHMLRRELKRMVRHNRALSLLDVRKEAIRWVEEGQPTREKYVRPLPQTCETQATATSESVGVGKSELAELKSMFIKQQAQLDLITQRLDANRGASRDRSFSRNTRFQRAPDGRPICLKCTQPGHIARYCTQGDPPAQMNAHTAPAQSMVSENYHPPV